MATASGDAAVKIWSVTDYTCLKTFDGHDASVLKVCFCSAGMQLLSTGKPPTAVINSGIIKSTNHLYTFQLVSRVDSVGVGCS